MTARLLASKPTFLRRLSQETSVCKSQSAGSHEITPFEMIQVKSCAKALGRRLCCEIKLSQLVLQKSV